MKLIRLIARRAFDFTRPTGGVLQCAAGETFDASPIEAVLLRVRKDADFAPPSSAPVVPLAAEAPKPRRRYLRRDMTAEDRCNSSD